VHLYTRNGNDFTKRFSLVIAAVAALLVSSCLIDGDYLNKLTAELAGNLYCWQ